ncbi:phage protein Gp36 family protein [Tropicibacter sp. Alg240-R139]|uniref:phage protein Gp36 family protein n=1 Tax=Tropicibacter sp. Alg240-R139 TaxID=2305991 RepID=UPI0013E0E2D9|nr:phage protein Gp36 family protein [Tropicibacter sp. Alg240-R139]
MTYATVDDLKNVIPARDLAVLTDRDGPADTINDAALTEALDDDAATIDSYISKQLSSEDLPLSDASRRVFDAWHQCVGQDGRSSANSRRIP